MYASAAINVMYKILFRCANWALSRAPRNVVSEYTCLRPAHAPWTYGHFQLKNNEVLCVFHAYRYNTTRRRAKIIYRQKTGETRPSAIFRPFILFLDLGLDRQDQSEIVNQVTVTNLLLGREVVDNVE